MENGAACSVVATAGEGSDASFVVAAGSETEPEGFLYGFW